MDESNKEGRWNRSNGCHGGCSKKYFFAAGWEQRTLCPISGSRIWAHIQYLL